MNHRIWGYTSPGGSKGVHRKDETVRRCSGWVRIVSGGEHPRDLRAVGRSPLLPPATSRHLRSLSGQRGQGKGAPCVPFPPDPRGPASRLLGASLLSARLTSHAEWEAKLRPTLCGRPLFPTPGRPSCGICPRASRSRADKDQVPPQTHTRMQGRSSHPRKARPTWCPCLLMPLPGGPGYQNGSSSSPTPESSLPPHASLTLTSLNKGAFLPAPRGHHIFVRPVLVFFLLGPILACLPRHHHTLETNPVLFS